MSITVRQSLHIRHSADEEPIPVTLYLSPEVLDDDGISAGMLADILRRDIVYAIEDHREQRQKGTR